MKKKLKQLASLTHWVSFDHFFDACQGDELWLQGWAGEEHPLYKKFSQDADFKSNKDNVLGALSLNGDTYIFFVDPEDGYRSSMGQVLLLQNQIIDPTWSPVPVRMQPTSDKGWDGENDKSDPSAIDLCAVDLEGDQVLVSLGTEYSDSYYPSGYFNHDPRILTQAMPFALQRQLQKEVSVAVSAKPAKRAPKKI